MLVPKLRFKHEDGTEYPEWEEKKLKDISRYIVKKGTGTKNIFVGTENMRKNCAGVLFVDSDMTSVKGIIYEHSDILFSNIRPYLKKAWKADRSGICSSDVLCIRANNLVDSNFLYTIISSDSFFEYTMQGAKGTKMPRGDKNHIMNMPVFVPCLEEQQKIADFLYTVDEVIAQSEKEVQNLEQQKKAAMQKIFSQEVHFKREDGTNYPKWKYTRIDEVAEINPKTTIIPETFYYMDLGSVSIGIWQEKVLMLKDNSPSRARRLANVGDVFFQSVRPYNMGHYFFIERFDLPVVASTGFIQLRAKQGYCNSFIYQLLYEDRFNVEVSIRCTGSNYPAINGENFSDIEMLFPCLEEQQKIADFLSAFDEAITYAKQELDKWKELKKGLLQQMFV